ncbi:aminoglycoside phosphotransferase family protein [Paenibacillus doosanensis]|nr:aminoglycoside phosphotransferase family protein [Paenibacillus doosanensis]
MPPILLREIPREIIEHSGTVKSIRFPRQGHTSDVGIIECAHGRFVLKRAKGEQYCAWLSREVGVLSCLHSGAALPVPRVYRFVEQKEENQSWALLQCFEGETLREALTKENSADKKQELIFRFGASLAQIHAALCPEALVGDADWLDDMLRKAEFNLARYATDGTAELLELLKRSKPAPIENTLIHGDFTLDNALVHDGSITGIIDWSGGAFGDPRYDVSLAVRPKPGAMETDAEREAFFEGYGRKIISEREYRYFENGLYEFF